MNDANSITLPFRTLANNAHSASDLQALTSCPLFYSQYEPIIMAEPVVLHCMCGGRNLLGFGGVRREMFNWRLKGLKEPFQLVKSAGESGM